jgi:hypothetical protein
MTILKNKKSRKSNNNNTNTITKFNIVIAEDTAVEFRPSGVFTKMKITTEQLLKVLHNGIFGITAENNDGDVNYTISIPNNKDKGVKQVGFINYHINDLDDDSTESEITESIDSLKQQLLTVTLEDIHMPMSTQEADDLLNAL